MCSDIHEMNLGGEEYPIEESASDTDILANLNPEQLKAVQHYKGPILILAGAGSGKTRVLTRRVAHLVQSRGVKPYRILAVTFTNKATQEMKERLASLLGERADGLWVSTFHSTCLRILRRHAHLLGFPNNFTVYDDDDSKEVLKRVLAERGLAEKAFPPASVMRVIDQAKNSSHQPEKILERDKSYFSHVVSEVYARYQELLFSAQAMDFGDLMVNAVRLLLEHRDILEKYQHDFEFILVDEFQDTNPVQYTLIRMLSAKHRNLLVVGDDDQSIYAFRGATIENILNFERDFPDAAVIKLEQNYRSTKNILDAAHDVIQHNSQRKGKKLWTASTENEPLRTFFGEDETEESSFVANEILQLRKSGVRFDEIAVFYRTNAQSRSLEEALMALKIPYRIFGGLRFYDRKEIKDVLAYLRLIANDSDDQAFARIINTPTRGIGAQTVDAIRQGARSSNQSFFLAAREVAESHKAVREFVNLIDSWRSGLSTVRLPELIQKILEDTGYTKKLEEISVKDFAALSRLENLRELVSIASAIDLTMTEPREVLREFLDHVALASSADTPQEKGDATEDLGQVSLMTLHLAKGLEYPVVFFTGFEEGLLPHYRSNDTPSGIEEERRLCYVGMTRAKRRLYLTRTGYRGMFAVSGGGGSRRVSRFALDIEPHRLESRGGDFFSEPSSVSYEPDDVDARDWSGAKWRGRESQGVSLGALSITTADNLIAKPKPVKKSEETPPFGPSPEEVPVGTKVTHPKFGEGTVAELNGERVTVEFSSQPKPKKFLLAQSRLSLLS